MKERRSYLNPDIKVISIRGNSDIIQTSGADLTKFSNIGNIPDLTKATKLHSVENLITGFKNLFNN